MRDANYDRLRTYFLSHPCVDCGERDPVVLEFDHIRDKSRDISNLLGFAWERVASEIAKCEVRGANCPPPSDGKASRLGAVPP